MSSDLSSYKVAAGETPISSSKFNNLVQKLQDSLNGLGGGLTAWASGKNVPLTQLAQGGASTGQALLWNGTDWSPAAAGAMTLLCSQVLSGSQASFDTNTILGGNIPQTYNHLRVVIIGRDTTAGTGLARNLTTFNNDSGANYDYTILTGTNGTPGGTNAAGANSMQVGIVTNGGATALRAGTCIMDIPCYTLTTFHKQVDARGSGMLAANALVSVDSGVWKNTAAITRIATTPNSGSYAAGSAFYLYGVL